MKFYCLYILLSFSFHSEVVQTHIEFLEVRCSILSSILPLWLANALYLFHLGLFPPSHIPSFIDKQWLEQFKNLLNHLHGGKLDKAINIPTWGVLNSPAEKSLAVNCLPPSSVPAYISISEIPCYYIVLCYRWPGRYSQKASSIILSCFIDL